MPLEIIGLNIAGVRKSGVPDEEKVEKPEEEQRENGNKEGVELVSKEEEFDCFLIGELMWSNLFNKSACCDIRLGDCLELGVDSESLASEHDGEHSDRR